MRVGRKVWFSWPTTLSHICLVRRRIASVLSHVAKQRVSLEKKNVKFNGPVTLETV